MAGDEIQSQVSSDLNKLTKDKLIFIIINKKVPEGCVIGDAARNYLEGFFSPTQDAFYGSASGDHILCEKIQCLRSVADLRVARAESSAAKSLLEEKERSVQNLDTIISLLKPQQSEVNKHKHKQTTSSAALGSKQLDSIISPSSGDRARGGGTRAPLNGAGATKKQCAPISSSSSTRRAPSAPTTVSTTRAESSMRQQLGSGSGVVQSNLATDVDEDNDNNGPFTKYVPRRKRAKSNVIIGSSTSQNLSIRQPLHLAFLHVYKLHPETTVDELKRFLLPIFPEVQVEKLNSKYPNYYSSFKVTISESKMQAALTPTLWPRGVCVNRFFHPKAARLPAT